MGGGLVNSVFSDEVYRIKMDESRIGEHVCMPTCTVSNLYESERRTITLGEIHLSRVVCHRPQSNVRKAMFVDGK